MKNLTIISDVNNTHSINMISLAVDFFAHSMKKNIIDEKINKLSNQLKVDSITVEKFKALTQELEKNNQVLEEINKYLETNSSKVEEVINSITGASLEYAENRRDAVINVFKVIACGENKSYFKYVFNNISQGTLEELYNLFTRIHEIRPDDINIGQFGYKNLTRADKEVYKKLAGRINKLLHDLLYIPVANEYTKKVNVRFNKTDFALLHSVFVKGATIKTHKSKNGVITCDSISQKFAITCKEVKDSGLIYKGGDFFQEVAKIAFSKLC